MHNIELSHDTNEALLIITNRWASHGLQGLWVSSQQPPSQNYFHITHHKDGITLVL